MKDTLVRLGKRTVSSRRRLLGSGFFGNAHIGICFNRGNFALGFDRSLYGLGFSFCSVTRHLDFYDLAFDFRFARIGETSEENCSGSACKEFRHLSSYI